MSRRPLSLPGRADVTDSSLNAGSPRSVSPTGSAVMGIRTARMGKTKLTAVRARRGGVGGAGQDMGSQGTSCTSGPDAPTLLPVQASPVHSLGPERAKTAQRNQILHSEADQAMGGIKTQNNGMLGAEI